MPSKSGGGTLKACYHPGMTDDDQQSLFGELPALTPPSRIQQRLIRSAVEIEADDPDAILFQHTVFCQTGLPYRNPGPRVYEWERAQGRTSLLIEAGRARDPKTGKWLKLGLPFGPKPRLILVYLNAEALRSGSPEIEVDQSLTAFVKRIALDPKGRNMRIIKDQLARLSASQIRLCPQLRRRLRPTGPGPHSQRLRSLVSKGRPPKGSLAIDRAPFPRLLREPATPRRALRRAGHCRPVAQRHGARHLLLAGAAPAPRQSGQAHLHPVGRAQGPVRLALQPNAQVPRGVSARPSTWC